MQHAKFSTWILLELPFPTTPILRAWPRHVQLWRAIIFDSLLESSRFLDPFDMSSQSLAFEACMTPAYCCLNQGTRVPWPLITPCFHAPNLLHLISCMSIHAIWFNCKDNIYKLGHNFVIHTSCFFTIFHLFKSVTFPLMSGWNKWTENANLKLW